VQLTARQRKKPGQYDCAGCDREKRKCLMFNDAVTVKAQGFEPFVVSKESVDRVFEAWAKTGRPQLSELETLELFGLCPVPLITPFSAEAMKLYVAIDGLNRVRTIEEYYDQPAIWHEVCMLLDREKTKWQATQTS